ncbi:MAG: hypothetical protein II792_00485 [Prevotella sp.]|nr:hypothetical protein [Prevotella sp.]
MKTTKFFLMAALALTFAACSNEDNEILLPEQPAQPAQTEGITITATLAPKDAGATTRAVKDNGDGKITATWAEGEYIGIVYEVGGVKKETAAEITDVDAEGAATITFTVDGGTTDGTACTLIYPEKAINFETKELKSYTDWLGTQYGDLSTNLDVRVGAGTIQTSTPSLTVTTQPAPQYSIFKFTVQDTSSSPITPTVFAVSDIAGKVITTVTPGSATSELYAALPALSAGTYLFGANVGGEPLFAKANVKTATTAGTFYQTTVKMKPVVDLSKVDNAGNPRATQCTANCYMVHEAGLYKLPLVYGNAIKNGVANTAAYTGISDANTTLTFPNHAGKAISDPWIKNNKDASDANIIVSTAELLWQDAEGLITAVRIGGDYLALTVGKDATEQQGNAVIAAKDVYGDIVWSWHIWVTTETFADATLTTVATGSHNYQVTPVNLGWVPTSDDGKRGYNTYYQWGRKDAFFPGKWNSTTDHTVYDINGTEVTGLTYTENTTATIADNIKNPTTFYRNTDNFGPCNTTYYNMWDAQQTGADNIAAATKKTVYDPCPADFCVPTGNLYNFMGNDANRKTGDPDDTNKGRTWTNNTPNLYFPASGNRNYNKSGSLTYVGSYAYVWSASACGSNLKEACGLGSYCSSSWGWSSMGRAYGNSVRAVAEE